MFLELAHYKFWLLCYVMLFQGNTTELPNLGVLKGRLAKKKKKKKKWHLDLLIFSPHMLTNIMNLKKK